MKLSTKISTMRIQIVFSLIPSAYVYDYAALRRCFFAVWTSHHLHLHLAHLAPRRAQELGYRAAMFLTFSPVLAPINLAISLVNPNLG